jgi:hypothetical protein
VGNNRQDPGPLFHLRHDKDVVHAETGGFRFAAFYLGEPLSILKQSGIIVISYGY